MVYGEPGKKPFYGELRYQNSLIMVGLPEEGKKAISDWMQTYKKGCEDFKKLVNDNYEKVEAFFAGAGD